MNDKELKFLVETAKDIGITATAFDEIYKICGGCYCEILNVLNDCKNTIQCKLKVRC